MANEPVNTTETTETAAEPQKAESTPDVKALQAEIAKLKQAVTNASADASKYKKALQERQTAEEKAETERNEREAAKDRELQELRNERNIANHKAQFVSIGFDDVLAQESAEALNSGDTAKVFDGIRRFIETHDKLMAEKAIMNNPTLPGGNTPHTTTREEFKNMGYREMVAFKQEHPDLYKEYTNNS